MRKHQHKQLIEILETIGEAQNAKMYADARYGAVALSDFIEQQMGEGTKIVKLLREYCELLLKAHNGEVSDKLLNKQFYKIDNSIRFELKPDKIEIVFLCYNASMSDSVLSIYQAAKADPNCNAVWMPIPYYEKNPDGSFRVRHYEGAEYYPGIECTDWQKYDIEARHPDVIVTYNPYDEGNYVTSVHPLFYTKRLRGLTDLLIYTPYFVVGDELEEAFATVAGCVYAHRVIVQSENICEAYIKYFKKHFGNQIGEPEKKFIALGSPKFDAVINAKREDFSLPGEWREIIGDKKVVFYNTSVGAILRGNEQYLKQLRMVIKAFNDHKDVVLWWRPHPLSEQTYDSMRMGLAAEYRAIVEEYRAGFNGIYDSTADLHRAIAWSDVYYGDGSSIVELFRAVGKPFAIQDIGLQENEGFEIHKVTINTMCFQDNFAYFAEDMFNAFCKVDLETGVVDFIDRFPAECASHLYRGIVEVSRKLYFVSLISNKIAVYDLNKKVFLESIEVDRVYSDSLYRKLGIEKGSFGFGGFNGAIVFGNKVYFIPYRYPSIVCLNSETNELEYIDDFAEPLAKLVNADDRMFIKPIRDSETSFVVAAANANALVICDTLSNTSKVYEVGKAHYRFSSVAFDGKNYWLTPRLFNMPIVVWNKSDGIVKEIEVSFLEKCEPIMTIYQPAICGNYIYYFSSTKNPPFKIDITTGETSMLGDIDDKFVMQNGEQHYFSSVNEDSAKVYLYKSQAGRMFVFDMNTNKTDNIKLKLSLEANEAYSAKLDGDEVPLCDGNAGQRIYDFAKKFILDKR